VDSDLSVYVLGANMQSGRLQVPTDNRRWRF